MTQHEPSVLLHGVSEDSICSTPTSEPSMLRLVDYYHELWCKVIAMNIKSGDIHPGVSPIGTHIFQCIGQH